jgi:cobalt-zinc-cadmium efflux system outer membrane protein
VEEARGLAIQSSLYPNPTQDAGNPQQLGGTNSSYTVGLTQEIVRGGKLRLDRAAADQAVLREQANLVRTRFEVLATARRQFFVALVAQRRVDVYRELLDFAQRSERASENLRQGGQIGDSDVLLVRIERRRIEASLREADNLLEGHKRQLAAALGVPGMSIDRLAGDLEMPLPTVDAVASAPLSIASNAELNAARAEIGRSRFLLDRALVEPIPNLLLQTGYQWNTQAPHNMAVIGTYFSIPIWNRNQGNIRAARAGISSAVSEFYIVRNDLLQQLADAVSRYHGAEQRVAIYKSGVLPDAERARALVLQGYEHGVFDIFRVIQSQRAYLEAFLEYVQAEEDSLMAGIEITRILQLPFP